MKKLLSFLSLTIFCSMVFAQTVTLVFTGQDTNKLYVQLSRVNIENATQNWQLTINYPDTVLELGQVGIENYKAEDGFVLLQNNPNPFESTTYSILNTVESGEVVLTLTDMNGRTISMQHFVSLQAGKHQFRINIANTGTYLLTALQNGKTSSVKMVNNGKAAENKIEYVGIAEQRIAVSLPVKSIMDATTNPFNKGDEMVYTGYATVNGTEYQSQTIRQNQNGSEDIVLLFNIVPSIVLPTVVTDSVSKITGKTAIGGGEVTDNGGDPVTARGVCWSTEHNPTIEGSHTSDGSGNGHFTSFLTDLTLGTTYYVRAYATNSVGTAYGEEKSFITKIPRNENDGEFCPTVITLPDYDGNIYYTVQIGDQCWMRKNMRTTHYSDGTSIPLGEKNSLDVAYRYYPKNDSNNVAVYGYLYNWSAVMHNDSCSNSNPSGVQGICPRGWHVPSDAEWKQLMDYVSSQEEYICHGNPKNISKALASSIGWEKTSADCSVGNNYSANNATGFAAMAAGAFNDGHSDYSHTARFWSSTKITGDFVYTPFISVNNPYVNYSNDLHCYGYSVRCLKDNTTKIALVKTSDVTAVTQRTASCGGEVVDDGGSDIFEWGVCYGLSSNPTAEGMKIVVKENTGIFTCTLTGLKSDKTYYARAYAINSDGVAYGNEVSFVTESASAPIVSTSEATSVMKMSAVVGGNVLSDGDSEILERGVCYSKKQNPTVANTKITTTGTTGTLSCTLTGLEANTTYYVRAYAVNSEGTAYGNQVSFTTMAGIVCGTDSTTDHEGNVYHTVSIGKQCWTRENMRCKTSPSTGTTILEMPAVSASFSGKKAYYYNDNPINSEDGYGLLYNWCAAVDTFKTAYSETSTNSTAQNFAPFVVFKGNRRGICPKGWHVPSNNEWTELTDYMSKYFACDNNKSYNAKELASARDWLEYTDSSNPCVVGVNAQYNNATDFSALPAGRYDPSYGYVERRSRAYFWSATQNNQGYGNDRQISYSSANVSTNYNSKHVKTIGHSVRCLSDEAGNTSTAVAPTILTSPVSEVENATATVGGNITDNGGTTVVASGVCWNTHQNPTISDYHTVNDTYIDSFVEKITNLIPGTTYYVRAYATNSAGIMYGEQISFTTKDGFLCGKATVSDYDGNVYNTIAVGSQCWLKENLKCTHYSDGVTISLSCETNDTLAHRYYPDDNRENVSTYGYLYNWQAVMYGASSSSNKPSGVQGICPIGWHVPSDAEWTQLTDYVSGINRYVCNQTNNTYIAKALASDFGWVESYNVCGVGNNQKENNETGFSAVPAGCFGDSYKTIGKIAEFCSTTQQNTYSISCRRIDNIGADVLKINESSQRGFSVRCLKD